MTLIHYSARFAIVLLISNFITENTKADELLFKSSPEECSFIDLRQDFPMLMRNQRETSWCFAHAASDLLQFSYKINEQISAADIAINYSESKISKLITFFNKTFGDKDPTPAQTGFIKLAIQKILPQGYCPESSLPSDEWSQVDSSGNVTRVEITQAIRNTLDLQSKIHAGSYNSPESIPWYFEFKNIQKNEFYNLLKFSSKKTVFSSIRNAACLNDRKPFPIVDKTKVTFSIKGKKAYQTMHSELNQRKAFALDFFGDVLRNYGNPKRRISELHTVLVYGRKFDSSKNECQFLIKDSYGSQCSKYDPLIECESGNLWISENKLQRSMTSNLKIE